MKEKLQHALKDAMRAKDKLMLDTLRSLISACQYEEMASKSEKLSDEQSLTIIRRELKKRKEQLEFAEQANRQELIEQLNKEAAIIEGFLPRQLSQAELEELILGLKQSRPGLNIGGLMKALREEHAGCFDSKQASELAKKLL